MLPRERVQAALSWRTPDRIPLQVHPSPAGLHEHGQKMLDLVRACDHDFGDCTKAALPDAPPPEDFDADGRYHAVRRDAWGTTWEYRIFGIWGHPIDWPLNDFAALDAWRPPEAPPLAGTVFEAARAAAKEHRRTWYLWSDAGAVFEALRWLRRFELVLMDLEDDSPEINRLADLVNGYNRGLVAHALAAGTDGVCIGDDLGTQNALMIRPEVMRRFFLPRYRELFAPALAAGRTVLFHTCGQCTDALADLKAVGATAIWPQLPVYDMRELARRCRDLGLAVLLHPDRGDLMQRGTPAQVRDYVLRMLDTFDTAHGGSWLYVEVDPGFPFENVAALFEVAMEVRRR